MIHIEQVLREKKWSTEKQRDRCERQLRVPVDVVPSVLSMASQSSESNVTLREEITAEGSLDFHGS